MSMRPTLFMIRSPGIITKTSANAVTFELSVFITVVQSPPNLYHYIPTLTQPLHCSQQPDDSTQNYAMVTPEPTVVVALAVLVCAPNVLVHILLLVPPCNNSLYDVPDAPTCECACWPDLACRRCSGLPV